MPRQAATDLDTDTAEHLSELSDGIDELEKFADGELGGDGASDDDGLVDEDEGDGERGSGEEDGGDEGGETDDDEAEAGAARSAADGTPGAAKTGATTGAAATTGKEGTKEGTAAAAPITREDGATWNGTANRWQKDGKFVEGEAPATAAAEKKEATTEQQWEPFAIKVDRAQVPIEEAVVSRANGHTFIAVPDAKFADFQRRIVRGYAAERAWRGIQQREQQLEREAEIQKNRPAIRSDSEVEADLLLDLLKDKLPDVLEPHELDNLQLRVKLAQHDEKEKLSKYETDSRSRSTEAETTQRAQDEGIAQTIVELVDDPQFAAEFSHLTDDDLRGLVAKLQPVRASLYWKEGDQWMRNTQYMYDRLKELAASRKGAPAASTGTTDATPPKGGTTATAGTAGTAAATRAERLNRAGDTAAKPKTTSVKDGRTASSTRPPEKGHHRADRTKGKQDARTPAMKAEDTVRKTTRSYLNSPSLDFEDGDEDE